MLEGDTPQKRGRSWEPVFAKSIGGKPVKMSGAGFTKLDVGSASVWWSLKYTEAASATISNDLFREALEAINGPGGVGGMKMPGLALNIQGQEYVVLRKDDAMFLMNNTEVAIATPESVGQRDKSKQIPAFLRGIE